MFVAFRPLSHFLCGLQLGVEQLRMQRVGIPPVSIDYTEELHMLADYLDFEIAISGVRLENVRCSVRL